MSNNNEKMREFYDEDSMRRHQHHHQMMMQQHQMMQMHMMQQQQQFHMHQMMQMQMRPNAEFSGENRRENGEGSSRRGFPEVMVTNLDRLMRSVTPFVSVEYLTMESNGSKPNTPYFSMGALWEAFSEWSAYGAGVPLVLNGKDLTDQYYVPFLSGIQLYADPSEDSSQRKLPGEESDAKSGMFTPEAAVKKNILRSPVFEYLESEPPHNRRPLSDTISLLVSQHPELSKYRSCDLHPTSWICVAWYPIYRIPLGPTMQDLEASFLTFHSLSTHSRGNRYPPQFHPANTIKLHGSVVPAAKISLPVFGLASYKLKGSILGPRGAYEREQGKFLMNAAYEWLRRIQAHLFDFEFFRSHSSYRR